ncbi:MAG: hypothetical protein RKP46_18190 [Candidatus Accumulibacter sp.]|uniref:hypothetical protein n=1 Tax=Accumulibacter sp. TaxID=2053492 RepID=UPI002879F351|nr:hypothetical protein [Accumulibacter sp.]MDS4016264.1 hypothetical protein [Accumulibacter sp.]
MSRGGRWLALALALAAGSPGAAAEPLGRLFFSAEQRQQLDRRREMNILEQKEVAAEPSLTIDGVVLRSSGRRTTWVNGIPQDERQAGSKVTIRPQATDPGRVVVRTSDARTVGARVGDTLNRQTGEVTDGLNGGRISARPGAAR